MRSSPFLAVFKWTVLTVVFASAVLWVSFHGLAQQPPAPRGDCPLETIANLARQSHVDAVRPQLGCNDYAAS